MTSHRTRLVDDAIRAGLTLSQAQVLTLRSEGLTIQEAAAHLGISVHTANHHLQNARDRLGASSTVELLALIAYRKAA